MSQDVSFIKRMTPEQALKYYKGKDGYFRRLLSQFTSLLRTFFGKTFRGRNYVATASGVKVRTVRGGTEADNKPGRGDGRSLIVDKVTVPGPRVLKKSLDALGLRNAIDQLAAIIEVCSQSENESMRAEVKEMNKRHNAFVDIYEEALHSMDELAHKNMPDAVADLFKRVQKYFDGVEKARIDEHTKLSADQDEAEDPGAMNYYVNVGTKEGVFDFVLNCDVTAWRNLSSGFHKSLVVVVTARLEPQADKFATRVYVNILDRMAVPHLYNVGREVVGGNTAEIAKKLIDRMDKEVALHDVVMFSVKAQLDVDATEIQTRLSAIPGVTGVTVEPEEIIMEFPDDNREIQTKVINTLNQIPAIEKLLKQGYVRSLRSIDTNVHSYSLALK